MTARILECGVAEYHTDPCEVPSLSASMAHTLVAESAEKAFHRHPRLGNGDPVTTTPNDAGSLVHALLLGADDRVVIVEADDFRAAASRSARDAALAGHLLPVTRAFFDRYSSIAERLRERFHALGFDFTTDAGRSELAIEWRDEGVLCRSMLDHALPRRGVWWDLKTSASAHPRDVGGSMYRYGYDIQAHAYDLALTRLDPSLAGRVQGTFLFAELEPPYAVNVVRPSGLMRELGRVRWERARALWARCLSTGIWPGYADEGVTLADPPAWAMAAELGREAA